MSKRYRLDPVQSRFTVQAFAAGLLSLFAHSPTFAVRKFAGEVRLAPGTTEELSVEVVVQADSLELLDRVSASDRQEIEGRMRREVLKTPVYPEIVYQGSGVYAGHVADKRSRFHLQGRLALHGVTNFLQAEAGLIVLGNRVGLGCEFLLSMSAFRIRQVAALGGSIRLKDELRVAFDLVGSRVQEAP